MAFEDYRKAIFEQIGYKPTTLQWPIHLSSARIKLVAGGERGGKSVVGSKEAVLAAPQSELIWVVGPEYDIARTEFEYILDDLQNLKLVKDASFPRHGPCCIEMHGTREMKGCRIVTRSAKEPQKLGMEAPDFILVCEAAQLEYEAYLRLRGRLAEKRAGMVMTGTFEGSIGWYAEFYTRWQAPNEEDAGSFSLPSWSNEVIYPGGENDPEILKLKNETPHDVFMERYAGVPCKPSGLIMSEFSNVLHVGDYEFDPEMDVEIAVDPGYAGAHAVEVIQRWGEQIAIVDEIYLQGYTTEEIIDICKQRKWWGNLTGGAIDIAGRQHHAMEAPIEVWHKKANIHLRSQQVNEAQGIDAMRAMLLCPPPDYRPKVLINHRCKGIISECGGCKSPVPNGGPWLRDTNTLQPIPKNDHACKAFIYWLVNNFGYTTVRKRYARPKSMLVERHTMGMHV